MKNIRYILMMALALLIAPAFNAQSNDNQNVYFIGAWYGGFLPQ